MESNPLFADEPDETRTAILKATFEALAEHGYADLTIDRIGEYFPKSEGVVFYHYDGKDDVLLDLLDYLLDRFEQMGMPVSDDGDPETRLRALFDPIISTGDQRRQDFEKGLIELRTRAAQDEEYRRCFNQSQDIFRETLRGIIEDGIESGDFKESDPDLVADFLITLVSGDMFDRVTTNNSRQIRSELDNYIEQRLLIDKEDGSDNEDLEDGC